MYSQLPIICSSATVLPDNKHTYTHEGARVCVRERKRKQVFSINRAGGGVIYIGQVSKIAPTSGSPNPNTCDVMFLVRTVSLLDDRILPMILMPSLSDEEIMGAITGVRGDLGRV